MNGKMKQIWFATWNYLNQPIFEQKNQSVWKPSRFWYLYKIQLLEKCWQKPCYGKSPNHQ